MGDIQIIEDFIFTLKKEIIKTWEREEEKCYSTLNTHIIKLLQNENSNKDCHFKVVETIPRTLAFTIGTKWAKIISPLSIRQKSVRVPSGRREEGNNVNYDKL